MSRSRALGRFALCSALLWAACRTPPTPETSAEANRLYDLSLDLSIERSARAQRVGQIVSLGGVGICRDLAPVSGMAVVHIEDLDRAIRDAAVRRFGSRRGIYVTRVFDGLPAATAGVEAGDRIVEIGDSAPHVSARALRGALRTTPPLVLPAVEGAELRLAVERRGNPLVLQLPIRRGCASPISVASNDAINALAWNDQVVLLSGLLRFMTRDEPLALVLGHEIGHVVLGHSKRRGGSVRDERDADYIGAYLASRAGFALTPEDYALLRLSYEDPTQLVEQSGSTHPSGPERQLAFERTLEEIRQKRERGVELVPDGLN